MIGAGIVPGSLEPVPAVPPVLRRGPPPLWDPQGRFRHLLEITFSEMLPRYQFPLFLWNLRSCLSFKAKEIFSPSMSML